MRNLLFLAVMMLRGASLLAQEPPTVAQLVGSYDLSAAHLFEPFWKSKTVHGEAVLCIKEADAATADGTLLFVPAKVIQVRNARTGERYEEGKDYTIDAKARKIVLTSGSRMPFLNQADLYKKKGEKRGIGHKVGDPETLLLWSEGGFQDLQIDIDYERAQEWKGWTPPYAGATLPRTTAKLAKKEELRIAMVGDSITAGGNASSKARPPHQPAYPALVAAGIEKATGAKVALANFAVGGSMANGGMLQMEKVKAFKPDLLFIAYGMNDVSAKKAEKYAQNVKAIMDAARAAFPEIEFVLVATSRANTEWQWTPVDQFDLYRDALAKVAGEGAAFADMTTLWGQVMERKRYHDLTGNGVNHPNDYGHRLQAQAILQILIKPEP